MSFGKWSDPNVPHKGWQHEYAYDLFGGDASGGDGQMLAVCEMCEKEPIRYIHVVSHPDYPNNLEVGCICASKMTEDYDTPKHAERNLKNRQARRTTWIKNGWRKSAKGNLYRRVEGKVITIYRNTEYGYKSVVGNVFSRQYYPTVAEAKGDAFDRLHGAE